MATGIQTAASAAMETSVGNIEGELDDLSADEVGAVQVLDGTISINNSVTVGALATSTVGNEKNLMDKAAQLLG
ncbi:MAG: hypothetical protein WC890_01355 [Candidatus Margulisiibacteriota bacterium]